MKELLDDSIRKGLAEPEPEEPGKNQISFLVYGFQKLALIQPKVL